MCPIRYEEKNLYFVKGIAFCFPNTNIYPSNFVLPNKVKDNVICLTERCGVMVTVNKIINIELEMRKVQ